MKKQLFSKRVPLVAVLVFALALSFSVVLNATSSVGEQELTWTFSVPLQTMTLDDPGIHADVLDSIMSSRDSLDLQTDSESTNSIFGSNVVLAVDFDLIGNTEVQDDNATSVFDQWVVILERHNVSNMDDLLNNPYALEEMEQLFESAGTHNNSIDTRFMNPSIFHSTTRFAVSDHNAVPPPPTFAVRVIVNSWVYEGVIPLTGWRIGQNPFTGMWLYEWDYAGWIHHNGMVVNSIGIDDALQEPASFFQEVDLMALGVVEHTTIEYYEEFNYEEILANLNANSERFSGVIHLSDKIVIDHSNPSYEMFTTYEYDVEARFGGPVAPIFFTLTVEHTRMPAHMTPSSTVQWSTWMDGNLYSGTLSAVDWISRTHPDGTRDWFVVYQGWLFTGPHR